VLQFFTHGQVVKLQGHNNAAVRGVSTLFVKISTTQKNIHVVHKNYVF